MAHTEEILINGMMTPVTAFDSSAQDIDDAAGKAKWLSNPNLLDNWYFGNPVDQRGGYVVPKGTPLYEDTALTQSKGTVSEAYHVVDYVNSTYCAFPTSTPGIVWYVPTSYAVRGYTGSGYTIDRWRGTRGNTVIRANDLYFQQYDTVTMGFYQTIENGLSLLAGKTVTFSVLVTENTGTLQFGIKNHGRKVTAAGETGLVSYTETIPSDATGDANIYFLKNDLNGFAVKAVKLELGSQQTLAHFENGKWVLNEIPNFAEELAKCQRYYENSWYPYEKSRSNEGFAHCWSVVQADGEAWFHVVKRATPTTTVYDESGAVDTAKIYKDGSYLDVTAVALNRGVTNKVVYRITKGADDTTTWTPGATMQVRMHWEASADL